MTAPSEPYLIVAAGAAADCQNLVQKFTTATPPDYSFRAFAEKWKAMNFGLVFCCRPPVEAALFTQEILSIVKEQLISEGLPCEDRVGYMFLLYSLYYKQNFMKKIRLTMKDYHELFTVVQEFKENDFREAEYAFFKLFFDNAFIFCATPTEFTFLHKNKPSVEDEAENRDYVPDVQSLLVEGLSKDSLAELELLHTKYEELKKNFPSAVGIQASSESSEQFIPSLKNEIETVRHYYEKYRNARPPSRPSSSASTAEGDHGAQRKRLRKTAFSAETDEYLPPNSGESSRQRGRRKK